MPSNSWRKSFVKALVDKDSIALAAVFQENPRVSAQVIFTESERWALAEAWAESWIDSDAESHVSLRKKQYRIARLIQELPNSLFAICYAQNIDCAQVLIAHAKPHQFDIVDRHNRSPLFYAALMESHATATHLTTLMLNRIKEANDPSLIDTIVNQIDEPSAKVHAFTGERIPYIGKTLLHRVCYEGNVEVMQLLIDNGAEIITDENMSSPAIYLCTNNSRHKTDEMILRGLAVLEAAGMPLDMMEPAGLSLIHVACDQYAHGHIGSSVVFYLMTHNAFSLMTEKDKFGWEPLSYLRENGKLDAFEKAMRTQEPMLYLEYALIYHPGQVNKTLRHCLENQGKQTREHLSKVLQMEGYLQLNYQMRNSLIRQAVDMVIATDTFDAVDNNEFKFELLSSLFCAKLDFFVRDLYVKVLKDYYAQRAAIQAKIHALPHGVPVPHSLNDELISVQGNIEMEERMAKNQQYLDVTMIFLTMPQAEQYDTLVKQAMAYLVTGSDAPRGATLEDIFNEAPAKFCQRLLQAFHQLMDRRHRYTNRYSSATAQRIIGELISFKSRHSFFNRFIPGLAFMFAEDFIQHAKADTKKEKLANACVVLDALLEAGEFPGARELLEKTVAEIIANPLAAGDYRLMRQAREALTAEPKAQIQIPTSIHQHMQNMVWSPDEAANVAILVAKGSPKEACTPDTLLRQPRREGDSAMFLPK